MHDLIPIAIKREYAGREDYPEDVTRIQEALARTGRYASREECTYLWEKYSDSMAAGWLYLPETDEEILSCISYYYE